MEKFERTVTIEFGVTKEIDKWQNQRYDAALFTFARELFDAEIGEWYGRETLIKGEGKFLKVDMFSVLESKLTQAETTLYQIIGNFDLTSFTDTFICEPYKAHKDYAKAYKAKEKLDWTYFKTKKINK